MGYSAAVLSSPCITLPTITLCGCGICSERWDSERASPPRPGGMHARARGVGAQWAFTWSGAVHVERRAQPAWPHRERRAGRSGGGGVWGLVGGAHLDAGVKGQHVGTDALQLALPVPRAGADFDKRRDTRDMCQGALRPSHAAEP